MSQQDFDMKPVAGVHTYIAPNSPELGVVRFETSDGSSQSYVVTKQSASQISKAIAELADLIVESQ